MRGTCRALIAVIGSAIVASCAVGPNYVRPKVDTTAAYKEQGDWKPSEPSDALTRGPWWQIFSDPVLDDLEKQVDVSNQTLKSAEASYFQARAVLDQARAGFFPVISATAGRDYSNGANAAQRAAAANGTPSGTTILNSVTASASWELDVWGKIRRTVEANTALAQSSAAAVAAARLSAQGTLAATYFQLRSQDQLETLLADTVAAETRSLKIAQDQYNAGVAAKADVLTAETQLLSSQALQVNAQVPRATLEHAIAVLVGKQPAQLSVAAVPLRTDVPTVPAGVPSTLLERRPDVAEAERKVAAANAQIGVAVSAYFPSLSLAASDGYEGNTVSHLFNAANRVWSFGPSLAETLFAGGALRAQTAQARFAHDASVAEYRQTVLTGFQQVEDEIATLRILEQQASVETAAVKVAQEAQDLTLNQYKAGTVPYSSVVSAQTAALSNEEAALTVLLNRLNASVALIEALGGGWDAAQLNQPDRGVPSH